MFFPFEFASKPFHPLICDKDTLPPKTDSVDALWAWQPATPSAPPSNSASPAHLSPSATWSGGGPSGLRPGYWTDDTSMALCLADSLITHKSMNHRDQMGRCADWYQYGYLSSTGTRFDIGNAIHGSLMQFLETDDPRAGPTDPFFGRKWIFDATRTRSNVFCYRPNPGR